MIIQWIIVIVLSLILLKYGYLISKRFSFYFKIKKVDGVNIKLTRNLFRSVFIRDGKPDIEISFGGKKYRICLITTRFRRCAYHFASKNRLEIKKKLAGLFVVNRNVQYGSVQMQFTFTRRVYNLDIQASGNGGETYVIPLPSPSVVTAVIGTEIKEVFDGDEIFKGVKICGAKHLREKVLKKQST